VTDVFEEVEEQLRADRYRGFALKALPWVLAGLLAALVMALGVWGYETYRGRQVDKASEQYAQALDAMEAHRTDEAFRLWGEVAKSPSKAYKALALMQQGGIRLAAGKRDEAVKLFDEAAAAAPNDVIGDAARLKSAFALLDTAPYKDLEARLTPMTQDGHPYRPQAREALGFAKLMAGDLAGARDDFNLIRLLPDASPSARDRAQGALTLIDSGAAKSLPAIAKAAAVLPPAPEPTPGAVAPGAPAQPAPQPQTSDAP